MKLTFVSFYLNPIIDIQGNTESYSMKLKSISNVYSWNQLIQHIVSPKASLKAKLV